MPITSIDVIRVKYDHVLQYLEHVCELKEYLKHKGASHIFVGMTEAGGSDEIVFFSDWESIEARSKAMEEITPEGMAIHKKLSPCIAHHSNTLAFKNPGVHYTPKEGHVPHFVRVNVYKASGNPMEAGAQYLDLVKKFKAKTGGDTEIHALFHPIAFNGAFNLIACFEETHPDDNIQKTFHTMSSDKEFAEMVKPAFATFSPLSSRLVKPLTQEKLDKIKKAAH